LYFGVCGKFKKKIRKKSVAKFAPFCSMYIAFIQKRIYRLWVGQHVMVYTGSLVAISGDSPFPWLFGELEGHPSVFGKDGSQGSLHGVLVVDTYQ
jgi:hypothetical protein